MDRTVRPGRVEGTLTPPCSKSYAQRALAAALLAEGETVLRNIEFCDDTRTAMHCIETLGAEVRREGMVLHLTKKEAYVLPFSEMAAARKKLVITQGFQP